MDDPHAEVEIEPQVKPRAVWPREETQAFPSAYKLQCKPTRSPGGLCPRSMWKAAERPTGGPPALTAAGAGGRNIREQDQVRA